MEKYENYTDSELLKDLKKIVDLAKKAMSEDDFNLALEVKNEVHTRADKLKLQKYDNIGTRTFQIYRSAISEARAKSGGKWQKNAKSHTNSYKYKLDEIKIELNDRINFLER
ncbi:hypothetical protein ACU40M_10755 [Staphylococcus arlettae]